MRLLQNEIISDFTTPAPIINSITGPTRYLGGNVPTIITGTGFHGASSVKFGSVNAQWFVVVDNNTIRCLDFPVSLAGNVGLTITSPGGTSSGFTVAYQSNSPIPTTTKFAQGSSFFFGTVLGWDNNVWFSSRGTPAYVYMVPSNGVGKGYSVGGSSPFPSGGCIGPDGNIYFVDGNGSLHQVKPDGTITDYTISGVGDTLNCCVVGSDGNIWITDQSNVSVWRWVPSTQAATQFVFAGGSAVGICNGQDGNLWVADPGNGSIWKITIAGVATEHNINGAFSPNGICSGPDGNLWVADTGRHIHKVTTSMVVTTYATTRQASYICSGPDGNLWFSTQDGYLLKITTGGIVSEAANPGWNGKQIVADNGSGLWVADNSNGAWKVA